MSLDLGNKGIVCDSWNSFILIWIGTGISFSRFNDGTSHCSCVPLRNEVLHRDLDVNNLGISPRFGLKGMLQIPQTEMQSTESFLLLERPPPCGMQGAFRCLSRPAMQKCRNANQIVGMICVKLSPPPPSLNVVCVLCCLHAYISAC